MPKYVYRGNPGYEFFPPGAPPFVPAPGDEVELTAEQAKALGGEFEPVDGHRPGVGESGFDIARAKKAELIEFAETRGIPVDASASVAEIRAALVAPTDKEI